MLAQFTEENDQSSYSDLFLRGTQPSGKHKQIPNLRETRQQVMELYQGEDDGPETWRILAQALELSLCSVGSQFRSGCMPVPCSLWEVSLGDPDQ